MAAGAPHQASHESYAPVVDELSFEVSGQRRTVLFQFSVHEVGRLLRRELNLVFADLVGPGKDPWRPLAAVATFQRSSVDLVDWGEEEEAEKDSMLHMFYQWAGAVCDGLVSRGFWADFVDPPSGAPARGARGNALHNEIQGMQALLRYRTEQVGVCHLLVHPRWGTSCYPATLFTDAPMAVTAEVAAAAQARFVTGNT